MRFLLNKSILEDSRLYNYFPTNKRK